jgi:hypothetical protein
VANSLKTIFSFLVLIAIAVHFSIILLYTNPVFELKGKAKFYTQWYVYPFFDQGWKLFAPVPVNNYHLYVTYQAEGTTQKIDLIQLVKSKQIQNRFNGYEAISLALNNTIHAFESSTKLQNKLNGPIQNELTYTMLQHLVKQYLAYYSNNQAKNIQTILLVENVITHQQRVYFD